MQKGVGEGGQGLGHNKKERMQTRPRLHSFFFCYDRPRPWPPFPTPFCILSFFVMTDRGLGAGLGEGGARGLGEGGHASVKNSVVTYSSGLVCSSSE
jgi:hypothetical protein